jgi:hypothetical protein
MSTWDATFPLNTTKIRNAPTGLQNNFTAIEQADSSLQQWAINLVDRSTIAGPNTPVRIDDVGQVYCRTIGGANELFFLNSRNPANEIQITSGVPTVAANGEIFLPGGLLLKYGTVSNLISNNGTVTFTAVGLTAFPTNLFAVVASDIDTVSPAAIATSIYATTSFNYRSSDTITAFFSWIAIGN